MSDPVLIIHETCSCGAEFSVQSGKMIGWALDEARTWRSTHQHDGQSERLIGFDRRHRCDSDQDPVDPVARVVDPIDGAPNLWFNGDVNGLRGR